MSKVYETRDYGKFSLLPANRDESRGHVETLKAAFEVIGNLTRVQPILVNDKFQIIDGQHRFTACKELNQPIFYTKVKGLDINAARSINLLHRGWGTDDFAKSYAVSGDRNYKAYIELKEDYGFSHSIMLSYITNISEGSGMYKNFREGDFTVEDEEAAVERLEYLSQAVDLRPIMRYRPLALALLRVMQADNFDGKRMLEKLKKYGHKLERIDKLDSNLRQLEDLYNHNVAVSARVRLY